MGRKAPSLGPPSHRRVRLPMDGAERAAELRPPVALRAESGESDLPAIPDRVRTGEGLRLLPEIRRVRPREEELRRLRPSGGGGDRERRPDRGRRYGAPVRAPLRSPVAPLPPTRRIQERKDRLPGRRR